MILQFLKTFSITINLEIAKFLHFNKYFFFLPIELSYFVSVVELKDKTKYYMVLYKSEILKCNSLYS